MALLPTTLPAWLALALVVGGLGLAVLRRYPMSYTMGLLSIGVYVVQVLGPGCRLVGLPRDFALDCVMAELSFVAPATWEGERLVTPFTYMFVHADLFHLVGNMFILLTAGPALEERIGTRNFLVIYLLAGLAAAAASTLLWLAAFFPESVAWSPNVGASGAIFGVLTGFAVLFPRERLPMILPLFPLLLWLPAFTVLLLHLAINLVYVFTITNIAWWGHFAGFLVGLAVAPVLVRRLPKRTIPRALDVDVDALQPLATSNVQRSALRELERLRDPKTPDDRVLAEAWWERFVARAQCPRCGAKLDPREGALACPRGDFQVQALRS